MPEQRLYDVEDATFVGFLLGLSHGDLDMINLKRDGVVYNFHNGYKVTLTGEYITRKVTTEKPKLVDFLSELYGKKIRDLRVKGDEIKLYSGGIPKKLKIEELDQQIKDSCRDMIEYLVELHDIPYMGSSLLRHTASAMDHIEALSKVKDYEKILKNLRDSGFRVSNRDITKPVIFTYLDEDGKLVTEIAPSDTVIFDTDPSKIPRISKNLFSK